MKITQSQVNLSAASVAYTEIKEKTLFTKETIQPQTPKTPAEQFDILDLSPQCVAPSGAPKATNKSEAKAAMLRKLIDEFLRALEGVHGRAKSHAPRNRGVSPALQRFMDSTNGGKNPEALAPTAYFRDNPQGGALKVQAYVSREVSYEAAMSFNASATVKTADGQEINVNLELNMSRSFYSKFEGYVEQTLTDPLVINLNAASANITDTKFSFDLDSDGTADQISRLAAGSGFLALDRNGDGKINDGRELFGTQSGDGFADLAAFDEDHNGWIDESDSVFDKLRIWLNNADGTQSLIGLGQAGVGAIFLGAVASPWALGSNPTQPDARIASTGFFLRENGGSGTIQHVDLRI
ncbi:MAG: hypothetical protein LBN00_11145 [Oscillospiraceae bacterium]|jgi:hypothetical protein|nr:hypothetical protein [Oscillospiraceae bacterium]